MKASSVFVSGCFCGGELENGTFHLTVPSPTSRSSDRMDQRMSARPVRSRDGVRQAEPRTDRNPIEPILPEAARPAEVTHA